MNLSKSHRNWITVGALINLIRKPVASYTEQIVKKWHGQLCQECIAFGQCVNPRDCLKKKKSHYLCSSCKGWFKKLAASHRNNDKSRLKWRQNCDTSKWPFDAWEVSKFFMPTLGNNKSTVTNAESTDLSSLLHVLEWMKDAAFGSDRRVDLNLVKKLRSEVRNAWAHSPKQEMTDVELNNAFEIAVKFLDDLNAVFSHVDTQKCVDDIQFLKANGIIYTFLHTCVTEYGIKIIKKLLGYLETVVKLDVCHLLPWRTCPE